MTEYQVVSGSRPATPEEISMIDFMAVWQLIDCAPKDHRIIGWDGTEVNTMDWGNGYWQQVSDSGRATAFEPTHWMPIPGKPRS